MSEPIRYSEVSNDWNGEAAGLAPSADGEWVKYEDYARLHSQFANSEQENARLKAEVEKIETEVASIGSEYMAATRHYNLLCNNLKAEVERLRKAGDEMHRAIKVSDPILDWKIELWNAAKEGKPSV